MSTNWCTNMAAVMSRSKGQFSGGQIKTYKISTVKPLYASPLLQNYNCKVSVKNNANRFLFQKANLPIFIHRGKLLFSPRLNTRSLKISEPPGWGYCCYSRLPITRTIKGN